LGPLSPASHSWRARLLRAQGAPWPTQVYMLDALLLLVPVAAATTNDAVACGVGTVQEGNLCALCVKGMRCNSTGLHITEVSLLPGFWRPKNTSETVLRCNWRNLCLGGRAGDSGCAAGYGGWSCIECLGAPNSCYGCDSGAMDARNSVAALAILALVLVPCAYVWCLRPARPGHFEDKPFRVRRANSVPTGRGHANAAAVPAAIVEDEDQGLLSVLPEDSDDEPIEPEHGPSAPAACLANLAARLGRSLSCASKSGGCLPSALSASTHCARAFAAFRARATLGVKLRLLISYYQIAFLLPQTLDVSL
jgi:hypothetical protein